MFEGTGEQFFAKNIFLLWASGNDTPSGSVVILGRSYGAKIELDPEVKMEGQPLTATSKLDYIETDNNVETSDNIENDGDIDGAGAKVAKNYDIRDVVNDIRARICLTYRTGFEPIPKSIVGPQPRDFLNSMIFNRNLVSTFQNLHQLTDNETFTSDVGWGCMIRTLQLLLANAYQMLLLGRGFDVNSESTTAEEIIIHNHLIDMFRDSTSARFSIHNLIKVAGELPLQVLPGQWFGPSAASLLIQRLCSKWEGDSMIPHLEVVISESGDLDNEKMKSLFELDEPTKLLDSATSDLFTFPKAVLVLLPIRLGIENVSTYYHSSLFGLLEMPQCVGIAGGKPSSSYYFVGYEDMSFLYLDPHWTQVCYPMGSFAASGDGEALPIDYASYHTTRYLQLPIGQMDPSMMVGVLLTSYGDYENFRANCVDSGNKIVHFHSAITHRRNSTLEKKRKMSEFVNISAKDTRDDVFILVDGDEQDADFVDLGFESDLDIDIAEEQDEEEEQEEDNEIKDSTAEPVEVEGITVIAMEEDESVSELHN